MKEIESNHFLPLSKTKRVKRLTDFIYILYIYIKSVGIVGITYSSTLKGITYSSTMKGTG